MKRTWKNFKLDKNKVYMRIGQAVVCIAAWLSGVGLTYISFIRNTIY